MSLRAELVIRSGETILTWRTLEEGDYTIGRMGADIVVNDDDVSPRHAQLTVRGETISLTDLNSAAGTFVDGRRISGVCPLTGVQVARLGERVQIEVLPTESTEDDVEQTLAPQAAILRRVLPEYFASRQKYARGRVVETGGMGVILEANETMTGRRVAMKVLKNPGGPGKDLHRFVEEARITALLEHPNIVPVHELGIDEGEEVFYTMKFVEGVTLQEVLARIAQLEPNAVQQYPLSQLLTVFQKICDAVAFAHSRGIVHRDLKPANVMIGPFGEVLVMDWGLAKEIRAEANVPHAEPASAPQSEAPGQNVTADGAVAGTPFFMSPEQAHGRIGDVDERSDIYALGAILHFMLTLQPPVAGATVEEVLERVRTGRLEPLRAPKQLPHLPDGRVPDSLAAVAKRAMALNPGDRYQKVAELQAEIAAYQAGYATGAEKATLFKRAALAVRRHHREATIFLVSACALLAITVGGFVIVSGERSRAETALDELRGTAPVHVAQARALAGQGQFEEALGKIQYALALQPDSTEYLMVKGDLLESCLRFAEASDAYAAVVGLQPQLATAQQHRNLCELLSSNPADGALYRGALAQLIAASCRERRPELVIRRLAIAYGVPSEIAEELRAEATGHLTLNLRNSSVSDLAALGGLPIRTLDLAGCKNVRSIEFARTLPLEVLNLESTGVVDLAPLAAIQTLRELNIAFTPVADLSPLRALLLTSLDCSGIAATNFSPLATLPLVKLWLQDSKVTDLSFVGAMPLELISLRGCYEVKGLSALAKLATLRVVCLPERFYQMPTAELEAVRLLWDQPSLQVLTAAPLDRNVLATGDRRDEFREAWDRDLRWIEALQKAQMRFVCRKLPDGTWELNLRDQPISDLSILKGVPISNLILFDTPIRNISALKGMPLRILDLRRTDVADLSVLRGMPLRELYLWKVPATDFSVISSFPDLEVLDVSETKFWDLRLVSTARLRVLRIGSSQVADLAPLAGSKLEKIHADNVPVTDISPLASCRELLWAVIPWGATKVETLQNLPKLDRISHQFDSESEPVQTAEDFWYEFKQPWAAALYREQIQFSSKVLADGSWNISVQSKAFKDLGIFSGANVRELSLRGTSVEDLSPLAKLPLVSLDLTDTPVYNLAPLRALRLRKLILDGTQVSDLSPVREMPLEEFSVERCPQITDETLMRDLPAFMRKR